MAPPSTRERVFLAKPSNIQGAQVFASAFQFLTDGADHLRLRSWCSVAGVTVGLQGRSISESAGITPFGFVHHPSSDRTAFTSFHPLDAGALLNLGVFVETGSVKRGECFVELALVRGLAGSTYFLGTIVQGYVATVGSLAWPGSPIEHPTDGVGVIRNPGIINPVSGEMTATVPTNALWRLQSVSGRLNASGLVGTRQPALVIDDGATIYFRSAQAQTAVANDTPSYTWAPGMPLETLVFNGIGVAGLPVPCFAQAGHTIRTVTSGLLAGDLYSEVMFMVEEWIRP